MTPACPVCPAGTSASQPCTASVSTVCGSACMSGVNLNNGSFLECQPCQTCSGLVISSPCTITSDAVCSVYVGAGGWQWKAGSNTTGTLPSYAQPYPPPCMCLSS